MDNPFESPQASPVPPTFSDRLATACTTHLGVLLAIVLPLILVELAVADMSDGVQVGTGLTVGLLAMPAYTAVLDIGHASLVGRPVDLGDTLRRTIQPAALVWMVASIVLVTLGVVCCLFPGVAAGYLLQFPLLAAVVRRRSVSESYAHGSRLLGAKVGGATTWVRVLLLSVVATVVLMLAICAGSLPLIWSMSQLPLEAWGDLEPTFGQQVLGGVLSMPMDLGMHVVAMAAVVLYWEAEQTLEPTPAP